MGGFSKSRIFLGRFFKLRLLVCGPRSFTKPGSKEFIYDLVHTWKFLLGPDLVIIEGEANQGVDYLVSECCQRFGVQLAPYPADWAGPCDMASGMCQDGHRRVNRGGLNYCPTAGLRRNQFMLDAGRPERAIAIVDKPLWRCRGTHDMMTRVKKAGLPHQQITAVGCGRVPEITRCEEVF